MATRVLDRSAGGAVWLSLTPLVDACCLGEKDARIVPRDLLLGMLLAFDISGIPTDRVVWIESFSSCSLDEVMTSASPWAPAISTRMVGSLSRSETVAAILDDMEALARTLFPVWLPGAEGITTSAGAAVAAVRALAFRQAARTSQYGPFLADLATGAVAGRKGNTRRHRPEVRALGLGRVLAASFGWQRCVLALHPPKKLDEKTAFTLDGAAQWLVDHGRLSVWIFAAMPPAVASPPMAALPATGAVPEAISTVANLPLPTVSVAPPGSRPVAERPLRRAKASGVRPRGVSGKPHPSSPAEVLLEEALADRPWAAGRSWNCTVRLGTLVNPVRVDLLWAKEQCIVEVDGADHRTAGKFAADRQRDVMLQIHGYVVLRFTNVQVFDDVENVLALLQQLLADRRRTRKGR
ncbi:endonuclease domain-containing protein [Actinoplanes regularis]|nr:DUF559 domain-containing protein [Actinoplanes regularis]